MSHSSHPLIGKRIVITRPQAQSAAFAAALLDVGAIPILFPTIQLVPMADNQPLNAVLQRLAEFDWIVFTSANGVRYVLDQLAGLGIAPQTLNRAKVAVIGPSTAEVLTTHGVHIDLQPEQFVAELLLASLQAGGSVRGQRFLLLRAEVAREMLREELIKQGASVEEIHVYRTVIGQPTPEAFEAVRAGVDILTFTSPLTVQNFCELLPNDAHRIAQASLVACIGPITSQAVTKIGLPFRHKIVAEQYTVSGLLDALILTAITESGSPLPQPFPRGGRESRYGGLKSRPLREGLSKPLDGYTAIWAFLLGINQWDAF